MAYCTLDELKAMNPTQTITATSQPTQTQVEGFIDQIAAEIDAVLNSVGVSIPIAAPTDYLTKCNVMGAAAMALASGYMPFDNSSSPDVDFRQSQYENMLETLRKFPSMSGGDVASGASFGSDYTGFENSRATFTRTRRSW